MKELLRALRAGRVEIVLASSSNGLGRSVSYLVTVLREFVAHKVTLIVPEQGINTSGVGSKVFLRMLDAIEEFKHSVAREKINAGLATAKRRGVKLGRPQTVNRDAVKRLRARGLSGRSIVKELGIPSSSVFSVLRQSM